MLTHWMLRWGDGGVEGSENMARLYGEARRRKKHKKKITQRRRGRGVAQRKKEKSRFLASLGMTGLGSESSVFYTLTYQDFAACSGLFTNSYQGLSLNGSSVLRLGFGEV